jgi:hypothetical protein
MSTVTAPGPHPVLAESDRQALLAVLESGALHAGPWRVVHGHLVGGECPDLDPGDGTEFEVRLAGGPAAGHVSGADLAFMALCRRCVPVLAAEIEALRSAVAAQHRLRAFGAAYARAPAATVATPGAVGVPWLDALLERLRAVEAENHKLRTERSQLLTGTGDGV